MYDEATTTYYYRNLLSNKTIWRVPVDVDKDYIKLITKRNAMSLAAERVVKGIVDTMETLIKFDPLRLPPLYKKEYILKKSSSWIKHAVATNN